VLIDAAPHQLHGLFDVSTTCISCPTSCSSLIGWLLLLGGSLRQLALPLLLLLLCWLRLDDRAGLLMTLLTGC